MLVDQMERLSVSQRFRKYQPNGTAKTNRERSVNRLINTTCTLYMYKPTRCTCKCIWTFLIIDLMHVLHIYQSHH